MFENILETIGLPTKEATVYETLLKLGETGIKPLLRETGLKRGNLYDILYSLEKKGLCELIEIGKKTKFRPTNPNNLNKIAQDKKQAVEAAQTSLVEILPVLADQFKIQAARPYVTYYVGLDGVKKIYDLILERKHPLKILASDLDRDNPELAKLIQKQTHKQHLQGITTEALVDSKDATVTPEVILQAAKEGIAIKKLDNFSLSSQIIIFGNSVAISALKPYLLTTYIESTEIAQTLTTIFMQLWNLADGTNRRDLEQPKQTSPQFA